MSKKRLNYDDPRWQGMVWSNPLNIKSGDYLNDYYQALDAMRANALNATTGDVRKGKAFSQVDAMKTLKVDPVGYYFTPRIIPIE